VELLGWLVWVLGHHASGKGRAGGIQSTLRLRKAAEPGGADAGEHLVSGAW
jgi:hypothetical protein